MKLVREAIKLGNEYNGKWYFIIYDDNAEKLEKVENALRAMETGASVGGKVMTWKTTATVALATTMVSDLVSGLRLKMFQSSKLPGKSLRKWHN
ncbi:hypothetical protein IANJMKHF_00194 [Klebsiella phage CPRSA]|nr:hypothetical protein IANJMKHF_00194 [Klebsiella phage CPRSA]UQJ95586.1 hypothetical protein ALHIDCOG_00198 [Klebsiella phage CPRSB]